MEREDSETSDETIGKKPAKRQKTFHTEKDATYMEMLRRVETELSEDELKELMEMASIEAEDFKVGGKDSRSPSLLDIEGRGLFSEDNLSWLEGALMKLHNSTATNIVCTFTYGKDDSDHDFPSEPESSNDEGEDERPSTVDNLLKCIGWKGPRVKFTLKEFLIVRDYANNPNMMHVFWQTITALDHRIVLSQTFLPPHVSMRDFIYSLLCCSDDFLRQDIIEKLSACQLAVPFLLQGENGRNPEVLLWACRRIVKKWKGEGDAVSVEQPIVNYPTLIVSVLRIGEIFFSKSQLLNRMLSSSQGYDLHNFFLNKESDKVKPRLSSGNVEAIWFLPMSGKEREKLKHATTFFNLRGDCSEYPAQTNFCCEASDLLVVFISYLKMKHSVNLVNTILKTTRKVLLVEISDSEVTIRDSTETHGRIGASKTQVHQIEQMVCDFIVQCSQKKSAYRTLTEIDPHQSNNLQFDTDRNESRKARELVGNIFDSISFESVEDFKKKCFLLQESWQEWVKLDRTRFDSANVKEGWSFEQQMDATMEGKKQKRVCQLQKNFSKTMKNYYDAIKNSEHSTSGSQYFHCFLQEKMLEIRYKDTIKGMALLAASEGDKSKDMNCGNDADHAHPSKDQNVNDVTTAERNKTFIGNHLGAEHFLREMGQLYEAYMEIKDKHSLTKDTADIPLFPSIYVNLALQMNPLEIMDGDTGFVPITWLTAVLDKMTEQLQNPKVLVLSVVGVQSSGKSTLLNSMFGLRFPVRAGRCTRGLFARFLEIESTLAEKVDFKYLIVVDTEGIKSIDHEDHRFDNELVTFALSIANVTLFNISGENIGPDVAGILQIAAHALMRMKAVDLECRIKIIQQRVSDLTVGDRNKASVDIIKETLDEATMFAAEEEGLEGRYKQFSDVVELNFDKDLQYVPTLWTGGMAPPNHMYSEKVTRIRENLLQEIRKGYITPDLTLSTFTDRVRDVWSAVKEENFIFNFKDSVKAVDYNQFCLQYNKWILEMRQAMMNESLKCIGRIRDLVAKGDDIEKLKLSLDNQEDEQMKLMRKYVEEHILNHPRKMMMSKYKQGFLEDAHIALKDAKNQGLQRISEEYDIKKLEQNLPKLGGKWLVRMIADVKKKAQQIRRSGGYTEFQKVTDINAEDYSLNRDIYDLEEMYSDELNELWREWTIDIKKESGITQIKITTSDIKTLCEKLLLRMTRDMAIGSEIHNLFDKEGGIEKHINIVDFRKYINDKQVKAWIRRKQKSATSEEEYVEAQPLIPEKDQIDHEKDRTIMFMQQCVEKSINEINQQAKNHFDRNMFQLLVRKTLNTLSEKVDGRKVPHSLIAKGLMHLSGRAFDEVFKHIEIKGNDFSNFFPNEGDIVVRQLHRFVNQTQIELSIAEFIFFYIKNNAILKLKKVIQNVGYCRIYDRLQLPWDLLRTIIYTYDSLRTHYNDLFSNLCQDKIDISNFNQYYYEINEDNIQQEYDSFIISELQDTSINALRQVEEELTQSSSFKIFIDLIQKAFSINPLVKHARDLYDDAQPMEVCRHLTDFMDNWELNYEPELPEFEYSFWKIATGLSNLCSKSCPMCGMFCDNTMKSHTIHSSHLHRPRGMSREKYPGTNRLVLEDCSMSIQLPDAVCTLYEETFHCKDYKQYHPDWEILPSRNTPGKIFWRWCFVDFAQKGECNSRRSSSSHYIGDDEYVKFPTSWLKITADDALQSLTDDKNLKLGGRKTLSEDANSVDVENAKSESETLIYESENSHSVSDSDVSSDDSTHESSHGLLSSSDKETET